MWEGSREVLKSFSRAVEKHPPHLGRASQDIEWEGLLLWTEVFMWLRRHREKWR